MTRNVWYQVYWNDWIVGLPTVDEEQWWIDMTPIYSVDRGADADLLAFESVGRCIVSPGQVQERV